MADIVRRLYARLELGKAIVVADEPLSIQALMQRHWSRLTQKLQTKRGNSHETAVILDITDEIIKMQALRFSTQPPFESPQNDVFIMNPESLEDILPECSTILVLSKVNQETLADAATCLRPDGIVVCYNGQK